MKAGKSIVSRLFSVVLVMSLAFAAVPETTQTTYAKSTITAYLTVSDGGDILETKSGDDAVRLSVKLTGQSSYTVGDLFTAAHKQYCSKGKNGYTTEYSSDYDSYSVTKFWGITTNYNCGYYVNNTMASGLSDTISSGDDVSFFIYEGSYYDGTLENYSYFTKKTATVKNKKVTLTLKQLSYDESYNLVSSAVSGAKIIVNGKSVSYKTNKNGKVTIKFKKAGTYIISAKKKSSGLSVITAPYCVVKVK